MNSQTVLAIYSAGSSTKLMKAERENILQVAPYERTEGRKGVALSMKED